MIKNFDDIKYYLLSSNSKYDVIIISETWFKINNKDLYQLNGYKVAHTIRNVKRGGGVSIYIRDLFHLEIIKNYSKSIDSICDILTIKLSNKSLNNKVFIISGIYRSPTYDIVLFNDFVYTFLNSISNNNDTFICGDFNIDILNKNKLLLIDNFIDLFYQFSFFPTINKPTRIQNNCMSLIDNIFTNTNQDYDQNDIHINDIMIIFQFTFQLKIYF